MEPIPKASAVFILKIISISFLIGAVLPLLFATDSFSAYGMLVSGLTGGLIGAGCSMAEYALFQNRSIRWLRQIPLATVVVLRAATYSTVILVSMGVPAYLMLAQIIWRDPDFQFYFWLSAAIATAVSTSGELAQLLGREATLAVITGRYRRPRLEHRIVMFADLIGSTALAERLGDLQFHELLGDVSYDLSVPIEEHGGETYRYVGDAVIVTWPMDHPKNFEHSVACALGMVSALENAVPSYMARYGVATGIRIAIHCGPVAAGEVGVWKKEIALLGDTMNTAARVEGAARDFGVDIVISDDVKTALPPTLQEQLVPMPDYAARGKQACLTLWSVKPAPS